MSSKKITVLSAGNGGQALAGDLALQGHDVVLYDLPQFSHIIEGIRQKGNAITLEGKIEGTARVRLATTDIKEALSGSELVYFVAPSYGQQAFFDLAVPCFEDGQAVVLMPGNYGTPGLKAALKKAGKNVLVAETDNLPYACAATAPGQVIVRGVKKQVTLAAFPAKDIDAVEEKMEGAFCSHSGWKRGVNVLQTSMANLNMVVHCAPVLANTARIEKPTQPFEFYYEGVSESVCRLVEATDNERRAVAAAYGLDLPGAEESFKAQYGVEGSSLYEVIHANPAFAGKAPSTLDHRFITEDVPFALVPVVELARIAGVDTPVMDSFCTLFELVMQQDFSKTGQTAERMGFSGMDAQAVLAAVTGDNA